VAEARSKKLRYEIFFPNFVDFFASFSVKAFDCKVLKGHRNVRQGVQPPESSQVLPLDRRSFFDFKQIKQQLMGLSG
jgi:hypothetical protein